MASKRRTLTILLSLLALFLLGTVAVLSTISFYLRIDPLAYITEQELESWSLNNSTDRSAERIPRIIHQTWKTETLPERWRGVSQACRDLMPDYEHMLWTDASAREFIAANYAWFLPTFDAYTYPIQRADAIRYFVLHHFGGIYLDLDVGCLRPLDPLLVFPVILPRTIPVGISNDLMFAEKKHPFMEQTIHNLVTFDHSYILNYPTVMFSTGPMFLSAQFGLYTASHPPSSESPGGDVRILPKPLYGKNAKPGEAPNSFFEHYYGSSWHADDAAFITFLGKWGKGLMWVGLVIFILGVVRLIWQRRLKSQHGERRRRRFAVGRYDVVLPRAYHRDGSFHLDLGFVTVAEPTGMTTEPTSPVSSFSSGPPSPTGEQPILPLSFGVRSPSPSSETSTSEHTTSFGTMAAHAFRRAGKWVRSSVAAPDTLPRPRRRSHSRSRSRSTLFFLPAIFTPSTRPPRGEQNIPLLHSQASSSSRGRFPMPSKKGPDDSVLSGTDSMNLGRSRSPAASSSSAQLPPPPYEGGPPPPPADWSTGDNTWDEWTGDDDTR